MHKVNLDQDMARQQEGNWEKLWDKAVDLNPDINRKKESLIALQNAIREKKLRYTPPFAELMRIQLQYITPLFWIVQGGILLFMILFFYRSSARGAGLEEYLWWSSIAAAWMGVLSHGTYVSHFSHGMTELEQSCYINLSQMWTIRMILCTSADIAILTVFSGGVALDTKTPFGRVAVYLLVPFVLSNVCCLLTINIFRGGRGRFGQAALAVVMAIIAASPSAAPPVYTAAYLWVWFAALILGAVVFIGQIRSCYNKMMRGEMLCWS